MDSTALINWKYPLLVLGLSIIAACTVPPVGADTNAQVLSPAAKEPTPIHLEGQPTDSTLDHPDLDCTSAAEPTPAMTEGPYYAPGSPERSSLLEAGMEGTPLVIQGYVLTPDCDPISGAWLDFWQTDAQGAYDNAGFRLRGHQYTGPDGSYRLETVLPGEYPGRTAHIHVKARVPGGPVLTTQLFFPGSSGNTIDRIFSERLLVDMQTKDGSLQGTFNFILGFP